MSSKSERWLGSTLKYQTCEHGAASSMCPRRSRRTRAVRHLGAALFANHAAVLHPLVLAAQALPVLLGAENGGAEQAVPLGLERAVVDGLGLVTSPNDQPRIFSGEARPIRTASKSGMAVTRSLRPSQFSLDRNVFKSSTSRQSACSSRTNTLNDSGRPGFMADSPLHDRLVDLGPAEDVVGFHRQQFAQDVGPRRTLPEPTLPSRRSAGPPNCALPPSGCSVTSE